MMPLTGRTILVTEDEPDQQEFIVTILEDAGAEVITAHNGTQAMKMAADHQPELMTLDINMPGADVFQVLAGITEASPSPRICIVSGRPELRHIIIDRFNDVEFGFVDKPFTDEDLVAELERLIEG